MQTPVILETINAGDKVIGVATLNSEKSLNALSLAMAETLLPQLQAWADDPQVACVWLQGAGEKAFCAGGDIVAMYKAMQAQPGQLVEEVENFFTTEYQLDYAIQTYPKPIICWGDGIVMGGGMGLMNGASHRIVTERSLLAMPEVTIGLYPDVGATYFLNRMPEGCGAFLGMTGATMNASDALFLNLADQFVGHEHKAQVIEALQAIEWGDTGALNHQKVTDTLERLAEQDDTALPTPQVEPHLETIQQCMSASSVTEATQRVLAEQQDDKWFQKAQKNLSHGCPITPHLVWQQTHHGADLSLADCFRFELTLSCNCAVRGDFAEGIRALLIDKDKQPQWQFASVGDVTEEAIDGFFDPPWGERTHPLAALEQVLMKK
ncbi:enoyl-CoA hydratase/isomerase family protein [Idiomarina sp.]|uniref:enoyl-CoA hydratase/isomerase family protein n=1 Tax=Idiomarina sp. TaxID=1874361 RepID=UPI00258CB9E6|nr:enoyl-CoA hydratase/isomerase family protein [Idiomarina sp.]|tara:strand:+ start:430 stop:1566 length:1137 start_codon:yes stop_codon:yes gene_type:complete